MLQTNREPDTDAVLDQNTPSRPTDIDRIPAVVHPSKSSKWFNRIILAALVVVAIGLGIIFHWSFANDEVLVIKNSPFPARVVADPTGATGGVVFLTADYCKDSSLEGKIRISYVSASREVFLPLAPEKLEKGCNKAEVPVVIPKDLAVDTYKIKFHAIYDINPLKQNVMVDFESQPFKVGSQTP